MSAEAKTSDGGPGDGRKPVTWGVEQEAAASATNTTAEEAKQHVDPNQPALGESQKTSIRRTQSQQREWEARQDPLYSCKSCYGNWTRTPLGSAISREYSYLFNFVIAHLLFWAIAFPIILDHGYDNDLINKDRPWGSNGTGVFPVALALVIVASLLFISRVVSNFMGGVPLTATELITQRLTGRLDTADGGKKKKEGAASGNAV